MQKEDITLDTFTAKKESAVSLYTEEEIENIGTTCSWTKVDNTAGKEVNVFEVSSTSEDTYQPPSTSNTSMFMDLHKEDVIGSGSETVSGLKNNTSFSGDAGNNKSKPGLSLLGEYADSGNDTEEETQHSLGAKQEKLSGAEETLGDINKDSNPECASTEVPLDENQASNKTVEIGAIEASSEMPPAVSNVCLPVLVKTKDGKDVDAHTHPDRSFAKLKRSVSKEEGQISADSDSSDSERSYESRKVSKTQKDAKKDKNRKKDKKKERKKKKKKRKQKHSLEKKDSDATESEGKKERELIRSRSRESTAKHKLSRRSRSRSRESTEKRKLSRRSRSRSRESTEKRKLSRQSRSGSRESTEKRKLSRRSRSRSRESTEKRKLSRRSRSRSRESTEKLKTSRRSRSRSRESTEKRKLSRRSRSRSRDRDYKRRRRPRSHSQDKGKRSRQAIEQSKRSRSRSTSRRSSATNRTATKRNRDLKSRSRSLKRSVSPSSRRRDRREKHSPVSRGRKESPSLRRKRVSRSRSRRRSSERRKSRSPRRHTRSPDKRRRIAPERSPGTTSTPRKTRSPIRRERKRSPSPQRKSPHRTSSASDSLDSGHFTNIPLSKSNKPDERALDNKEQVQKPSPNSDKSAVKKQESSVLPYKTDLEKQYSPAGSPEKPWEDEFDFVFTERMSPRQGTEKSVEDVLFGTEAKTPDFKRPTPSESKKNKQESQLTEKKEETKTEMLKGVTAIADKENKLPQKSNNQSGSSDLQPTINADEQSLSALKESKSPSKVSKSDIEDKGDDAKKMADNADSPQTTNSLDNSAFIQSKPETIPFLDEKPYVPPPGGGVGTQNTPPLSQLGILGSPAVSTGLLPTPALHDRIWMGLDEVGLLPTPGSHENVNSSINEIKKAKIGNHDQSVTRKDEGWNNLNESPVDMEMSSPEGDIIDQMNEEFWKQQQKSGKTGREESKSREVLENPVLHEQSSVEDPYEPESGFIIDEESEEDLTDITDPKERRKREKQQQKEKTKVQELIDKLHRQARVEEEVKHALKAYYKHRDISKDEYKSILRRAVPQVTNSSSAIDPERIRSLVKKYVAKIKGQRVDSH